MVICCYIKFTNFISATLVWPAVVSKPCSMTSLEKACKPRTRSRECVGVRTSRQGEIVCAQISS